MPGTTPSPEDAATITTQAQSSAIVTLIEAQEERDQTARDNAIAALSNSAKALEQQLVAAWDKELPIDANQRKNWHAALAGVLLTHPVAGDCQRQGTG